MSSFQNYASSPPLLSLVGYSASAEATFLLWQDIGTGLAIAAHLLFFRLVFTCTPKEMFNYRITVTNTSTWCLLFLIVFGVLIRPVPLFPVPAAKVTGPARLLGHFWGGQFAWIVGVECVANFLAAAMNCFTVLAVFLLEPKGFIGSITRAQGVAMALGSHLTTTAVVAVFFTVVYRPVPELKGKLLAQFPELAEAVAANDSVLMGYDPTQSPDFMALLILVLFIGQGAVVTVLYGLLVKKVWSSISKGSKEQTARSRRNVVLMLSARMSFPTLFGCLPVMLLCTSLCLGVQQAFGWHCLLVGIAITHGFQNVCATIIAYRPYRQGILRIFAHFLVIIGINEQWLASQSSMQLKSVQVGKTAVGMSTSATKAASSGQVARQAWK